MEILGFEITAASDRPLGLNLPVRNFEPRAQVVARPNAAPVSENRGGWSPFIHEPFPGAWQKNVEWTNESVLAYHAVYGCVNRITSDVGKLRPKLMEQDEKSGIWKEVTSPAFSKVLRRPNGYQNHIQFKSWWVNSKLLNGNTYVLLERDGRNVVRAMYILDPSKVTPLVAPDTSVYYQLKPDNLSGTRDDLVVPASEIIHDRMNCLFHPLVGTSPIFACGAAANLGLEIENGSAKFFANGSKVSGQLLVPTFIDQKKADEFRAKWKEQFTGDNAGQIAVLSGGMKFEPMQMTNADAEMIEHLKWTAEAVCTAFNVPAFKLGIRDVTYANAAIANQIYYSDCLQSHIEQYELCMDDALGIGEGVRTENTDGAKTYGVELDLDGLLRMDAATQMEILTKAAGGAIYTPDEARAKDNKGPIEGGNTLYRQQQEFSLHALAKRDAKADPFSTSEAAPAPTPAPAPEPQPEDKSLSVFFNMRTTAKRLEKEKAIA